MNPTTLFHPHQGVQVSGTNATTGDPTFSRTTVLSTEQLQTLVDDRFHRRTDAVHRLRKADRELDEVFSTLHHRHKQVSQDHRRAKRREERARNLRNLAALTCHEASAALEAWWTEAKESGQYDAAALARLRDARQAIFHSKPKAVLNGRLEKASKKKLKKSIAVVVVDEKNAGL
ncbi:hypothetical protein C8R43DRAFT_1136179 [Mycena crocata]|nr:hypothetical protein C8R43DRAFT_1136179 [Mycena crocata]